MLGPRLWGGCCGRAAGGRHQPQPCFLQLSSTHKLPASPPLTGAGSTKQLDELLRVVVPARFHSSKDQLEARGVNLPSLRHMPVGAGGRACSEQQCSGSSGSPQPAALHPAAACDALGSGHCQPSTRLHAAVAGFKQLCCLRSRTHLNHVLLPPPRCPAPQMWRHYEALVERAWHLGLLTAIHGYVESVGTVLNRTVAEEGARGERADSLARWAKGA